MFVSPMKMAQKCPTCGKKGPDYYCPVCGKQICLFCGTDVFSLEAKRSSRMSTGRFGVNGKEFWVEGVRVCRGPCETSFLAGIKKHTAEIMRGIWEAGEEREKLANAPAGDWWGNFLYTAFFEYNRAKNNLARLSEATINERPRFAQDFEPDRDEPTSFLHRLENELTEFIASQQKLYRQEYDAILRSKALVEEKKREQELLSSISHCERVGRYEDAASYHEELAQIYETWELYDKARELRNKARRLLGKGPQVVVDLNKLLQQVRDGGIVAVYRCPRCGGKLKIDKGTNAESLRVCEHCGSEIETMELADFIRTALS